MLASVKHAMIASAAKVVALGCVRTENKSQCGDPPCDILTVIEHIFRRSEP